VAVVLAIGALTEAPTNIARIPTTLAIAAMVSTAVLWGVVEIYARRRGLPWRLGTTSVRVKSPGPMTRVAASSIIGVMAILVWSDHRQQTKVIPTLATIALDFDRGKPDTSLSAEEEDPSAERDLLHNQEIEPAARAMRWEELMGSKCADIFDSEDSGSLVVEVPGVRGDACSATTVLLSLDYFGAIGGNHFCAKRVPANGLPAEFATLARGDVLMASGERVHKVGCHRTADGAFRVTATDVTKSVACRRIATPSARIAEMHSVMGNSYRDEELSALDAGRGDAIPMQDASTTSTGDDGEYKSFWQNEALLVEAYYAEWAKGASVSFRVNGQILEWSEGSSFAATCSDFPSYVVSRVSWHAGDCATAIGTERLHRLTLNIDASLGRVSLGIDECTMTNAVQRRLERPLGWDSP